MKAIIVDGRPLTRIIPDPIPNPVDLAWMEEVFKNGINKPWDFLPFKYTDVDWTDPISISNASYHAFTDLVNLICSFNEGDEPDPLMETLEDYLKEAKWTCNVCSHSYHFINVYPINGCMFKVNCLCKVCHERVVLNTLEQLKNNSHTAPYPYVMSLENYHKLHND